MTPKQCPKDGCDYRGDVSAIKGHLGASTDHPNWSDLDDRVKADLQSGGGETSDEGDDHGDDPPEQGSDGGGSDPTDDDDPPDRDVEQDQTGQDDQNDHPEDDPMPTSKELEKQRSSIDHPDDGGDDDPSDPTDSDPSGTSDPLSGGIPIPVSTTTLAMGVGLILMGFLLWTYVRTSSTSSPTADQQVEADQQDVDEEEGDVLDDLGEGSLMGGGD